MNPVFLRLDEEQAMALTICREAGGESYEGKVAVGTIILERVDHRDWDGRTIKEVCFAKRQFSCFDESGSGYAKTLHIAENWDKAMATDFSLNECYGIAIGMISGAIPRTPVLSMLHCCQYLNPRYKRAAETKAYWLRSGMKSVAVIGNHEFFV